MNTPTDQMPPSPPPQAAPPPGPPEPPVPPDPAPGHAEDRNIAMLCHLSGLLLSVVVPLIVWLAYKDVAAKRDVVREAKEALNFQITVLIGYVICWVLAFILIGMVLFWLLWVANLVFCLVAASHVSRTGTYRYPFSLRLVN